MPPLLAFINREALLLPVSQVHSRWYAGINRVEKDVPNSIVIGLGCRRGASPTDMQTHFESTLAEAGISREQISAVATLAGKEEEPAIRSLANGLELAVTVFSAARLEEETPRLLNPSDVVFRETGCHGVAEAAALALAGANGRLIVPKRVLNGCTLAIAELPPGPAR